jgi:hypothetical protein
MLKYLLLFIKALCAALFILAQGYFEPSSVKAADSIIPLPPAGCLYHGVHPLPLSSRDEDLRPEDLASYEKAAGKTAAWVDISQHWGESRQFPAATAAWIRAAGSIPSIRLMLWSKKKDPLPDPVFTLDAILKGAFDDDFRAWGAAARKFGTPLIVEFGPEMNGSWYPWNGSWSGGGETKAYADPALPDGPEKFRDAYRHIIDVMRIAGARNILWVFHVNYNDWPNEAWNRFENYYPGDEYIDWLAVSIYGAQQPAGTQWPEFRELMEPAYRRLEKLSPEKPIIVAEFGVSASSIGGSQALWAQHALEALIAGRWPRVIGFAWWNAAWQNDANPLNDTSMRVQDNPALAAVFKKYIGGRQQVLGRVKH